MTIPKTVCCLCGLVKEVNEMGHEIWPEPWKLSLDPLYVLENHYVKPTTSDNLELCPECKETLK